MTNQQHPISVPQELLNQWCRWEPGQTVLPSDGLWRKIADNSAQWGADQELEACCEWAKQFNYDDECYEDKLRNARRPKAPSLKEQALEELEDIMIKLHNETGSAFTASAIRRGLEALPND
jgi:hypothetical protein